MSQTRSYRSWEERQAASAAVDGYSSTEAGC